MFGDQIIPQAKHFFCGEARQIEHQIISSMIALNKPKNQLYKALKISKIEALFRMRCGCWILLASFYSTLACFSFTLNHMFTCAAMEIRKFLSKHTTSVGRAIESLIKVGRANSQSMLDLPQVCLL
jgi:hypothetical protein